ncbi:sortase [Actinoplanes sp. NPDC026619]|uniref:sortase domain-containing protein n=1 Tax=Actinoplanes sp. NPDC026619 TaxID=3155798 RepID=UPI00340D4BF1
MTESYFPPAPTAGLREFRVFGASMPIRLEIPAIGVSAGVVPIGVCADGSLDLLPAMGDTPAAWYRESPTPGEMGSALIAGPAIAADGAPAVFYRLRLLRPGDRVAVRRADHRVARFAVSGVGVYPTEALPADQAYGPPDQPTLTLITVGGAQDRSLVVSARLLPEE